MTITFQHLVGTFEPVDKTIAFHIEADWDKDNTNDNVPTFENGTDEPDYNAQFDRSGPNTILVNTIENETEDLEDDEVNSDTIHKFEEQVVITIVAESRADRIRFENEINRILWEASPNAGTRLTKSDGTNSHINRFKKSEVTFRRIELPDNDTLSLEGSEGILTIVYYKFKT